MAHIVSPYVYGVIIAAAKKAKFGIILACFACHNNSRHLLLKAHSVPEMFEKIN